MQALLDEGEIEKLLSKEKLEELIHGSKKSSSRSRRSSSRDRDHRKRPDDRRRQQQRSRSRSPLVERRRVTNKGSRSRSRSPPTGRLASRLMDLSGSGSSKPKASVKDRLGPLPSGGGGGKNSKKVRQKSGDSDGRGFGRDHWRRGNPENTKNKKPGREERKVKRRDDRDSPVPRRGGDRDSPVLKRKRVEKSAEPDRRESRR